VGTSNRSIQVECSDSINFQFALEVSAVFPQYDIKLLIVRMVCSYRKD